MDEAEAIAAATSVLDDWKPVPFTDLARLVDQSCWVDRAGPSGANYAVKVYGLWDEGVVGGDLRVCAAAMDGTRSRVGFARTVVADFIVTAADQLP